MSQPGWYPDPGGAPGRLRWFDGQQWSTETIAADAPPPGARDPHQESSRRLWPLVLLGVVVLVAVAVIIGFVIPDSGPRDITDNPPTANQTISAWDDGSTPPPTPTPTEPTSTPPPTSDPPPVVDCPRSQRAGERGDHPDDGRIHGGQLSFAPAPAPWEPRPAILTQVMFFGYDVDGQALDVIATWFSQMSVGALDSEDGFTDPQASAEAILSCIASSSFFSGFSGRVDLHSTAVTISGRPGWSVRAEVHVANYGDIEGSVLEVIVVEGGDGRLSFFVGESTIGDQDQERTVQAAVDSLQVT